MSTKLNLAKAEPEFSERVKKAIGEERFFHCLRVRGLAIDLAQKHGADVAACAVTALLHDLGRTYDDQGLLAKAREWAIDIDDIESGSPKLLHGKIGAAIAARDYGLADEEILEAIRCHTTGRAAMGLISRIIYLSDHLEPSKNMPHRQTILEISQIDIDKAVYLTANTSLRHLLDGPRPIHPNTVLCRNSYLKIIQGHDRPPGKI